jgi:hypothetical protein
MWDDNNISIVGLRIFVIGLERNFHLNSMPIPINDITKMMQVHLSGILLHNYFDVSIRCHSLKNNTFLRVFFFSSLMTFDLFFSQGSQYRKTKRNPNVVGSNRNKVTKKFTEWT